MRQIKALFVSGFVGSFVGLFLVAGCGGGGGTAAPEMTAVMITAASGGTVALGGASLAVPGGSLATDTMVTLTSGPAPAGTPDSGTLHGKFYAFGPSGTAFSPPATLTLPADSVPAGKKAVISTIEDGGTTWTDLETTAAGGMLTAPVSHFSGFSIRYVVVGGAAFDCTKVKPPCGGPIAGAWTFAGVCVTDAAATQTIPDCPTGTETKVETIQGSATFNEDLTYALHFTVAFDGSFNAPASCIASSGKTFASCADVANAIVKTTVTASCTGTPSTGCACTVPNVEASKTTNEAGSYAVTGTSFTTTKTGSATGDDPTPFCVDGNTAYVQIMNPTGYLVLTK
jgi:hypothetical protein